MLNKIILASKSKVRKRILEENRINCTVKPSNVDEDLIKESMLKEGATPEVISKNLAELKANKVSQSIQEDLVLGADSVIDLKGKIISNFIDNSKYESAIFIDDSVKHLDSVKDYRVKLFFANWGYDIKDNKYKIYDYL